MSLFGLLVELVQIKRNECFFYSFARFFNFSFTWSKKLPFLRAHELLIHFLLNKSIHTKKCSKTFGAKEKKLYGGKKTIEMNTILLLYCPGFALSDSCPVPRPRPGYKVREKVFIEKAVRKRQFPVGNSLTTPCRQLNYILPI